MPKPHKYKDVEGAANLLLAKSGSPRLSNGIAIDVVRIVQDICDFDYAEIPNLNLEGPVLGAFVPEANVVLVDATCYPPRKRFTVAHELGHAQLEHDYGPADTLFQIESPTFFRCDDGDIDEAGETKRRALAEILANKFAAYLLMPEALVRNEWSKDRDVSRCAERLYVSRQALANRLSDLRLS